MRTDSIYFGNDDYGPNDEKLNDYIIAIKSIPNRAIFKGKKYLLANINTERKQFIVIINDCLFSYYEPFGWDNFTTIDLYRKYIIDELLKEE